jgi:hypothetical protein
LKVEVRRDVMSARAIGVCGVVGLAVQLRHELHHAAKRLRAAFAWSRKEAEKKG